MFLLTRILGWILLLVVFPLLLCIFAIIAIIIRWETPGPIFYVQKRLGKNRRLFPCLKFRTMYVNSKEILDDFLRNNPDALQEWQTYQKIKHGDPRITKVGHILRKTSLDEWPQFINILLWHMDLIGPRPYLESEMYKVGCNLDTLLSVRPGLTGLWQVSGRNNLSFEQRIKLDTWYVQHRTVWLDCKILLKTFYVVITADGAY